MKSKTTLSTLFILSLFLISSAQAVETPRIRVNFNLVCEASQENCFKINNPRSEEELYIFNTSALTIDDIAGAEQISDEYFKIIFTAEGRNKFFSISGQYFGFRIAVIIDNEIVMLPRFTNQLNTESVVIGPVEKDIPEIIRRINKTK